MRDSSLADSNDIKFACTQCGQHIVVEKSAAGLDGECPVCHGPVTVPAAIYSTSKDDRSHLDKGRGDAVRHVERLERELEAARAEIARQHALFKKAVEECDRLTANATHIQAESKSIRTDRQQLKGEVAHARQAAALAENLLAEANGALSAAQQENGALREQVENDLAVAHDRITATETQLAAREGELREVRSENSEIVQALAQAQAEFAVLSAEEAGLRKESAAQRQETTGLASQLATVEQKSHETRVRLEALEDVHRRSCQERDDWRQRAEALRHDLAVADKGRELLKLRARVEQLGQEHAHAQSALADRTQEAHTANETAQVLRGQLAELRHLHADAERRAEAGSESQLKQDNDVLRGIVERLNGALATQYREMRRVRRGRIALRLAYTIFACGLLALGFFALRVLSPQEFAKLFDLL